MFNRRIPRSKQQILREALWPSMGARRLASYYKHRIGRLPGTPSSIASGFATGVAISITPFIGLHVLLGGVIAWLTRASLIAMVVGTLVGNPWTFPFIWLATYKIGRVMMGHAEIGDIKKVSGAEYLPAFDLAHLISNPVDLLLPLLVGSVPAALALWLVSYYVCRHLVTKYRAGRLARILGKHKVAV